MRSIQIPVRELHARTGHYVRLASRESDVVITENGEPTARITRLNNPDSAALPIGERRQLLPAYRKALSSGKFWSAKDSTPELRETSALRDL